MSRLLSSKRGSTSAMLIFLMVVLIIFGVLAFMSAYANYRLGQSGQDWYVDAYKLDSQGEAIAAQMDGVLADAEEQARSYIDQGGYRGAVTLADAALQQRVESFWQAGGGGPARAEELFQRLYYYFAAQGLSQMGVSADEVTPEFSLYFGGEIAQAEDYLAFDRPLEADTLSLSGRITSLDGRRYLLVSLTVTAPTYTYEARDGALVGVRTGARFKVTQWQQQQPPLEPSPSPDAGA